jgi:hypothetical protein
MTNFQRIRALQAAALMTFGFIVGCIIKIAMN